jgi:phage shock protein A
MPNTAYTDIKGALDLLKNWPQEALLSPNLISFRKLLIMLLTEQQTVRTRARNLSQQLKTSEEQVKTLQKRIDAIKNMERTPFRRINP